MRVDFTKVVAHSRIKLLFEVSLFFCEFSATQLALTLCNIGTSRKSDLA